jgi:hypothetical protein
MDKMAKTPTHEWLAGLDQATRAQTPPPYQKIDAGPKDPDAPSAPQSAKAKSFLEDLPGSDDPALSKMGGPDGSGKSGPNAALDEARDAALASQFGHLFEATTSAALTFLSHLSQRLGAIPPGLRLEQLVALDASLTKLDKLGASSLRPVERSSLFLTPQSAEIAEENGIEKPPKPSWSDQVDMTRSYGSGLYASMAAEGASVDSEGLDPALQILARAASRAYLIDSMPPDERASFDSAVDAGYRSSTKLAASVGLATMGFGLPAVGVALAGIGEKIHAQRVQDVLLEQAQARIDLDSPAPPQPW